MLLHSTRAAVEEGVVPGGGTALVRAIESLEKLKGDNEDQNVGINIAKRALESPLRQIASNAGEESSVIVAEVRDGKGALGFNAATGEYGDMIEMGILDPAKVTRTALQAAGSVAGMMITTEAMVTDIPKDEFCKSCNARHGWYGWNARNDVNVVQITSYKGVYPFFFNKINFSLSIFSNVYCKCQISVSN